MENIFIKSFFPFRALDCVGNKMAQAEQVFMADGAETRHTGAEAEQAYKEGGAHGLKTFVEKKLNAWRETTVRIAIVGQSGAGKSSFINTIRCVEKKDRLFAKVGVVETTKDPRPYPFPDNSLITLWDLPGAGTSNFKAVEYAEEMKFSTFDAFVILSSERFTEIDKMIADDQKTLLLCKN